MTSTRSFLLSLLSYLACLGSIHCFSTKLSAFSTSSWLDDVGLEGARGRDDGQTDDIFSKIPGFNLRSDSGNRFEQQYLRFLSKLPSTEKYSNVPSDSRGDKDFLIEGLEDEKLDRKSWIKDEFNSPFTALTVESPFLRSSLGNSESSTNSEWDFDLDDITEDPFKSTKKLWSGKSDLPSFGRNTMRGKFLKRTSNRETEDRLSDFNSPKFSSLRKVRKPSVSSRLRAETISSVSHIEPDEKGCRTVIKEIHEIPGSKPKKVIKFIRSPRDLSGVQNKRVVSLFVSKDCSYPVDRDGSTQSEDDIEGSSTASDGSTIFRDSPKDIEKNRSTIPRPNHRWSIFPPSSLKDDMLKDDEDGDSSHQHASGKQQNFPTRTLSSQFPSRFLTNRKHRFDRNKLMRQSSSSPRIDIRKDERDMMNDDEEELKNTRISSQRVTGYGQRQNRLKTPKRLNRTYTYFKKSEPVKTSDGSTDYSLSYGQEKIQSYSEDYDSDRDDPGAKPKPKRPSRQSSDLF